MIVVSVVVPPFLISVQAAEPTLGEVLDYLGFTNRTVSSAETFSAGSYNITLYAEFAGYADQNELSYYKVANASELTVIFTGPEGGSDYIDPPVTKSFTAGYQFGLSMLSRESFRYYTETSRNGDGKQHAKVYENLDDPGMFLIGFENQWGGGDKDYNDMVFSLKPRARIWTDKADYEFWETVTIFGSGFNPNANINLTVTRPDSVIDTGSTMSNASGDFVYYYVLNGILGTYNVTATDGVNSASTTFTEARYRLQGYTRLPHVGWTSGTLKGWYECEEVPYRLKMIEVEATTYVLSNYHDNKLDNVTGIDYCTDFYVGYENGSVAPSTEVTFSVTGPFYQTPVKIKEIYYTWNVTYTSNAIGKTYYLYWKAHLASGSSNWPGAKLHARTDVTGCQDVPIAVPPGVLGEISGYKFNDLDSDGVWDVSEPVLTDGWNISLYMWNETTSQWVFQTSTTTDINGYYEFTGLFYGDYKVTEDVKDGWINTLSPGFPIILNGTYPTSENNNFGNYELVPPVACFTVSNNRPNVCETVTFNATCSYDPDGWIVNYTWNFGDTNITTVTYSIITHHYDTFGNYTATLTVTDNDGLTNSTSKPIWVRAHPHADFTWSPTSPKVGELVTFNGSLSTPDGGTIVSYEWDFGDNSPSAFGKIVNHTYSANGTYTVTLNVTDSEGKWDTESKIITVQPLRYYLTVQTDPPGLSPAPTPPSDWYDNCTYVNLTAPEYANVSADTRYRFDYWDVNGTSQGATVKNITVHMDANYTATAHYVLQYLVTFNQTGLDATANSAVVTVNGAPKTFGDLPFSMWADNGSSVTYNYSDIVSSTVSGKRFRLGSVSSPPSPFTVTGPVTITGNYKIQYQLTVRTNGLGTSSTNVYNNTDVLGTATDATPYSDWFDEDSSLQLDIDSPIIDGSTRANFTHWSGDATGSVRPLSVTMNSTKDITANYETQFKITFDQTGVGSDFNDTIVIIDGTLSYNRTTLPVSFWWDNGTTHTFAFQSPLVVTSNAKRYVWNSTSGLSSLQSDSINVLMSGSVVGNYKTQYYLTVTSPYGTPSGEDWYYESTDAYAGLDTGVVPGSTGTQYVFVQWTGDASGTDYAQSNAIHMDAPKTAIAEWKTQYYLTMSTNFGTVTPGSGWHDAGSTFQISASAPSVVDGERYVWLGWTGTGTGSYTGMDNPATITMDSPITETAAWRHEYRLTMDTNFGTTNPSAGEHWYEAGSTVPITATAPSTIPDEQYVWLGWTGTGSGSYSSMDNPASVTMDGPITETAAWRHEYKLTVNSPYGSPTPTTGWFEAGESITASVNSPVSGPAGTRYVCTGWTGTGSVPTSGTTTSVTFTINAPSSITWNWKTQYLLTVRTFPSGLSPQPTRSPAGEAGVGGWWYDSSTDVQLTAQPVTCYEFLNWDVDGTSRGSNVNPINVHMDEPHVATAHYKMSAPPPCVGGYAAPIDIAIGKEASHLLASQIGLAFALLAAMTATILLTKRRSKTLKRKH